MALNTKGKTAKLLRKHRGENLSGLQRGKVLRPDPISTIHKMKN
jgi:hypothetical protein